MTTTAVETTTVEQPAPAFKPLHLLASIGRDVAIPVGAYFGMHALGYSDFAGLLAGTVLSGALLLVETIRSRRLEALPAIILAVFVFGLAASFISGDPRMLIAKDSAGTALIGSAFLISILVGKPLTYLAARKMATAGGPARLAGLEDAYRTEATTRRTFRVLAMMWGGGLIAEAVVRVVLAYQLPIHTMAWLSPVLMVATIVPLTVITARVAKRNARG
ncbi:VC0807 family protein [Nocardia altamirensis]|uniref:VC0807 family protein n=1 Tax=Nocardia altamirensis TaxID=472158 RepID=UPI0008406392|nr:VC0807 family protein [Nocardia altamirensis]